MLVESFLEQHIDRLKDKTALVATEIRLTYEELEKDCNRIAHAFIKEGLLNRGDRVAVFLDNSIESALAIFGTLKAGGVFVVINPTSKPPGIEYLLNDTRATILVTDKIKFAAIKDVVAANEYLKSVIITDEKRNYDFKDGKTSLYLLSSLLHAHKADEIPPKKQHISIDLAALIYTSGSTGNPKGVMLSHDNIVSAATSITTYLENVEDEIIINVLPLSFDYGLYQLLMALKVGATLILEKSFTFFHVVMQKIEAEKVTGFPIVPTISSILLGFDLSKYDLSNLRYITNTAAALPTEHIRLLQERLPHVTIYSMYGLTECKRVSYLPPTELKRRPGSVGIAMPNTEAYIVDENNNMVESGVIGELVVRGPNVMIGYWEQPEATAKILRPGKNRREEVLYTGDLFKTDEQGFLYFVGRTDDIIKSRGEKVAPKEIENLLYGLKGIKDAAVLGLPDKILGEKIKAFVSLSAASKLTEKKILNYCRQNLQNFMLPQEVEICDALPKNPSGKIDKIVIKANESENKEI